MAASRRKRPRLAAVGRRLAAAALAVALAAAAVTAVPASAVGAPPEAHPQHLTVVLDNDYPPYVFPTADGGYQGILIDMWRLFAAKTGVPVTLRPMDWDAAQEAVRAGRADVIDMLFRNEAREKIFLFSKPYTAVPVPVFVHKDIGGIRDIDGLHGFTVGVKRGDATLDYLREHGVTSLAVFDGYEDVVRAAKDGGIKVFCTDKFPGLYYLYKFDLEHDFRLAFILYSGTFHRAVRKGDAPLLRFVEDGFARITPEERAAIDRRWRGAELPLSPLHGYGPWIAGGIGVAVLILLTFNVVLRRTVRRQTARLNDLLAAVTRSEERYRELVQGVGSVIVRLDPDGVVTFCNEYARQVFGPASGDLIGRTFTALIGPEAQALPEEMENLLRDLALAPASGLALTREGVRRTGDRIWVAWAIRPLRDASGQVLEILCVGNDVTERRRAEEALRESEERYALVARGANDGIWDWDIRTDSVYYSPRYKEILGYGPDDLSKDPAVWTKRVHPDDLKLVLRANQRCIDGEADTFAVEFRMRHRDGSYRWILSRGVSLRDATGRVIRMAGTHSDITRRRKDEAALRESQDQLAKIFRLTPAGLVLVTRRDERIIDLNEACARMFGAAKKEVLGHTVAEFGFWHHSEDREAIAATLTEYGSVLGKEVELRRMDGSIRVVLYSGVFNQAFGEPCVLAVLVDITERKAMEQALVRSKEVAEAANRAKSEFLSTMSHEIRTPMNTILGMVDVLAGTSLTERQSHALRSIKIAGGNLLGLLNNILDLSHIEAGGLIMEEKVCDPADLTGKVVAMLQPDAGRKGVELRLEAAADLPRQVYCCPERIRQVLVNLVGNAIKFTSQGEIVVSVAPERENAEDPRLRFAVRDTGIGIPADRQGIIFDRFTQANASSSRQYGGVGLGLAICKRLVEMMGGTIGVVSREGEGSTFWVHLPLRPASAATPSPAVPPRRARATPSGRVLLVEDSATNAEVMRLMLEDAPFELTWAPSGQAGLEAFREQPFDVVLMDVEMPEMDGYATTEALRALERELGRPHTPVVALTAHAFDEHRQRALAAGCDDFQIKPVPKGKLLDILETWMAVRA